MKKQLIKKIESEMCISRLLFCPQASEVAEVVLALDKQPNLQYDQLTIITGLNNNRLNEAVTAMETSGYLRKINNQYSLTDKARRELL